MSEKIKISCLNCGATNNYPLDVAGKRVVCGRCKTPLSVPGEVLEPPLNQEVNLIQNSRLPLLIDFYSPTCAPCHMMHPVVEGLAKRIVLRRKVFEVDHRGRFHPRMKDNRLVFLAVNDGYR